MLVSWLSAHPRYSRPLIQFILVIYLNQQTSAIFSGILATGTSNKVQLNAELHHGLALHPVLCFYGVFMTLICSR